MKIIKYIFYVFCILLLLLCAGVGVLALNPGLTDKIADVLYREKDADAENTVEENTVKENSVEENAKEENANGENVAVIGPDAEENDGSEDYLINPNPQQPIGWMSTWNGSSETEKDGKTMEERLEEAGITADDVLDTMEAYYKDCLEQFKEKGVGDIQFTNVVPQELWPAVERAYTDDSFRKNYVDEALKELKMKEFAIQLQVERLGGGYYRLYHNISTWN